MSFERSSTSADTCWPSAPVTIEPVAPAPAPSTAASLAGRPWKYLAAVNCWPSSFEPITWPFSLMREPSALFLNSAWATPVMASGYRMPQITVSTIIMRRAGSSWRRIT